MLPTEIVNGYWETGLDDNGNKIKTALSHGIGVLCRHCLQDVAAGQPYLILAPRPFAANGANSEMGPIFLHSSPCDRYA